MKTFGKSLLAASAAVLCWGCGNIAEIDTPASIKGLREGEILASIDVTSDGQPGKAGYKSNLRLDWEAEEEIKVGEATYRLIDGAGTSDGKFAIKEGSSTAPTDTVNCFAPADLMSGETGIWPACQGSADAEATTPRNVPLGVRTSIGGAGEKQIYFTMLGAVMCFELSNKVEGGVLDTIRIESEVEPISGPFTVERGAFTGALVAKLTGDSPEDRVITYVCPTKHSNIDAPKRFFVSIPAGSYTKLTVTFVSKDGVTATEVLGGNINPRDYINVSRRINLVKVKPKVPVASDCIQLWENGLFWAPYNIGAANNRPEDYGWYFMWGDTQGYEYRDSVFNKAGTGTPIPAGGFHWSFYCSLGFGSYDGTLSPNYGLTKYDSNGPSALEFADDAARANWGGNWRMPTREEFAALAANCYWTWTADYNGTGISGYIVYRAKGGDAGYCDMNGTQKHWDATKGQYIGGGEDLTEEYDVSTDLHLFFPATGYGYGASLANAGHYGRYWSRTLCSSFVSSAYCLYFNSEDVYPLYGISRYYGFPVRPIWEKLVEGIYLNATSKTVSSSGTSTLSATVSPADATNKAVIWSSSAEGVATVDQSGVVTGIAAGTATITATAADGSGKTATCTVTVK